jgi:glycosyltransferase involved in cell wall biosynthesis
MAGPDSGHASAAPEPAEPVSLSVVVPVYNEEAVLPEFHRRLAAVLDGIPGSAEVLYVNDGSRDGSMA